MAPFARSLNQVVLALADSNRITNLELGHTRRACGANQTGDLDGDIFCARLDLKQIKTDFAPSLVFGSFAGQRSMPRRHNWSNSKDTVHGQWRTGHVFVRAMQDPTPKISQIPAAKKPTKASNISLPRLNSPSAPTTQKCASKSRNFPLKCVRTIFREEAACMGDNLGQGGALKRRRRFIRA
ncbi:hypothetical protein BC830DRAFT_1086603 [Chytriomyces sp. MP71]|nr:hypothetical protein BC830DRAFT_1086603 [Chytriomyces sp. MP71]